MKLLEVRAGHGAAWVRRAFALFFRRPWAFLGLFGACFGGALFLNSLPFIGPLVLLAALPLGSLVFMIASRWVLENKPWLPALPGEAVRGPRARRLALLQLGVAYAIATILIMLLAHAADGGAFERLIETVGTNATPESVGAAAADPKLEIGMLIRFGLAGLLSVPFWHAPALVHWGQQSALRSLFFSTLACWRNRGAFAVYGLGWLAVLALLGGLGNLIGALFGAPQLVMFLLALSSLAVTTAFYASLYLTFADCFGAPSDEPAA